MAQLPVNTVAPCVNLTIRIKIGWMFFAAWNVNNLWSWNFGRLHYFGCVAAHSKLAIAVVAECKNSAVFAQGHRVVRTTFNFNDVFEVCDKHWGRNIRLFAMPQGSKFALTPSVNLALVSKSNRMLKTTSNLNNFFCFELAPHCIDRSFLLSNSWLVAVLFIFLFFLFKLILRLFFFSVT